MISLFTMFGVGVFGAIAIFFFEKFLPSDYFKEDSYSLLKKRRTIAQKKIEEVEKLLENDFENPIVQNNDIDWLKRTLADFMKTH